MAKVSVSVSVAEDDQDQFAEVVRRSKEAGLQVEQELPALGVITGRIDPTKVVALQKVKGVSHVEASRDYQLPPPDSQIQ